MNNWEGKEGSKRKPRFDRESGRVTGLLTLGGAAVDEIGIGDGSSGSISGYLLFILI